MTEFKLANVLLKVYDAAAGHMGLFYKPTSDVDYSDSNGTLAFEGTIDFTTYFNALSWGKWRKYADINEATLNIETAGDGCTAQLMAVLASDVSASDAPPRKSVNKVSAVNNPAHAVSVGPAIRIEESADFTKTVIPVPEGDYLLVGFTLTSDGATEISEAYWSTTVDLKDIRPVKLALATTTFRKEEYIKANICSVRDEVLASSDAIADAFEMFVVDNGRTLDVDELSGNGVTIIPNPNVGGSGGFARGMIAALEGDGFTHVLLMDDDVKVSPESFKRTFNLLSLAKGKYSDAFISGAMFPTETPNMQYEDVSEVYLSGAYDRVKGNLFMDTLADVAVNEAIDVELEQTYAAWWYACIPLDAVRKFGLPLPIFVRCDDVEYGMRCNPTYMTLNGICVWHDGFKGRHNAAIDGYQYIRNYLIMMACDGKSDVDMFVLRTDRALRLYSRTLAYETMDLMISGFEDYLKGPKFLMELNGEEILKANSAIAEKFIPFDEAIEQAIAQHPELERELRAYKPDLGVLNRENHPLVRLVLGWFRTIPYDKHLLPEQMTRSVPATAYHGYATVPAYAQIGATVVVACDRPGEHAKVRFMDKQRHAQLMRRWKAAKSDYRAHKSTIAKEWKDAMPEMTSVDFWKEFLARG